MTKHIALIGSTGSIGRSALEVIDHLGDPYRVVALSAHTNVDLLEKQVHHFQPEIVAVSDPHSANIAKERLPGFTVVSGPEGVIEAATHPSADLVLSALVGAAGIDPTLAAIESGKDIALANKEVLVAAGELVIKKAQEHGVTLLPVDSEHSALFQCIQGLPEGSINRLILTSSGGPFRTYSQKQLCSISLGDALRHPTWQMGAKITIDSSTLMNKGLEVIEAHWLFDIPIDKIDVVIHPQSIIHSMVETVDHSLLAQMSYPSMHLPIQYALTYPDRCNSMMKPFDFTCCHTIEFFPPDNAKFPCLSLAYEALQTGKSMPCYMNAANEVLVSRFLSGSLSWNAIPQRLEKLMEQHTVIDALSLEAIKEIDTMARMEANTI